MKINLDVRPKHSTNDCLLVELMYFYGDFDVFGHNT